MSIQGAKPKTSRSLASTLAIAFLALSLVILLITNFSLFFLIGGLIQESVDSKQQFAAKEAANTVSSFVQGKFGELASAAKIGELTLAAPDKQKNILSNVLGLDRAFRQLILLDTQNRALVKVSRISQTAAEQLMGRVDSDLLTQVKQGNRYIGSVYIDELTSEPMVIMAVPVPNAFGDFQGTLLAEVNLKFMWDLVGNLKIGETGQAYVVDRHGDLIASGDIARVLRGENVGHLDIIGEFMRNPEPVGKVGMSVFQGINGATVVSTYVPLGTPDWAVVTELPLPEAFQTGIQFTVIAVLIMLAVAVLAGLLAVYLARRLAAPLLNLTETATQIAKGKLNLDASVAGPTEVTQLANAFNSMTTQLRELIGSLEQRVADRTQRLEILAILSERLSAILDFEQLLMELVNQVKERFDYYHAHVYILDDNRQNLVMTAGAGQAGAEMKARGHHIPLHAPTSLVARAARSGEIVWVDNVREAEDWLFNPLLPDTYSEMAVPIVLEGQVVGVLDVQEDKLAGLDESDANLLRSLANHVAVAIRNARLFAEVEVALAKVRTAQEQYIGQAWKKVKTSPQVAEYQCRRSGAQLLDETVITYLEQETMSRDQATVVAVNGGDMARERTELVASDTEIGDIQDTKSEIQNQTALVAPIQLQNQTIGTIQLLETEGQRQWDEMELALVQTVAEQVAQSAENLRLFEETRQRAGREQSIRQITDKMRAATSLDELIKVTTEELGRRFSTDYASVELGIEKVSNGNDQ
jgi:GAF domain-containing protein/HAMP domain-containing protein